MEATKLLTETYLNEGPRMLAWLSSRVGDEAEDLLQDVTLRALANLDALEPVRDLSAWLWRGLRNAVIDAWRKRRRRGETDAEDFDLAEAIDEAWRSAEDEAEREELLSALSQAIDALPEEQRLVIVAQAIGGETFAHLSERTGVPPETLAARKRYALVKLRDALADFDAEE